MKGIWVRSYLWNPWTAIAVDAEGNLYNDLVLVALMVGGMELAERVEGLK